MNENTIAAEATRSEPCPLCGRDHYCYVISDLNRSPFQVICQWTDNPPSGWYRSSTAKDGRGVFSRDGYRKGSRRDFPSLVKLTPTTKTDVPTWTDHTIPMSELRPGLQVITTSGHLYYFRGYGNRQGRATAKLSKYPQGTSSMEIFEDELAAIATYDPTTGDKEQVIEYAYPNEVGPFGKVARMQWTDRRRVYEQDRKTKYIRPYHWTGDRWEIGKGPNEWPLYREQEARQAILAGEYLFACAGEQAVEAYRELGLFATTCQGGEANARHIVERLATAFQSARKGGRKPVLVIHPDNDVTGENTFAAQLLRIALLKAVPAVAIEPLSLWGAMPQGGDIWDLVHRSGMSQQSIFSVLETEIDQAIERREMEEKAIEQRSRWNAPVSFHGELGYWAKDPDAEKNEEDGVFRPKTDFDLQVERELVSAAGDGGLLLQIKRTSDKGQRRIFIKDADYTTAQKFEDALKNALGGSIICNLSTPEVKALMRVRLHEYHVNRKGKTFRLIDRVGQQDDGTWVFKDRQFTKDGQPTDENTSRWVWHNQIAGGEAGMPMPALTDSNPNAIANLVAVMRRAFGCNFYAALITLGYGAAGVHYKEILEKERAFPTLNLYGDPGSGKSTAAECALALVGMVEDGMQKDISLSAAYEKLKISGGLLYCLDDPKRDDELDEFLKGFYNGKARVVRGKETGFNVQRPHSPMMVTSNHACGEHSAATKSRLISLWFRKAKDGESDAFYELPKMQKLASGGFTQLIKLGYPQAEVHQLEQELTRYLPHAHVRIAKSLALVTTYAKKMAELAGCEDVIPGLMKYLTSTVCPGANDPDEAGDSLRDFVDKIHILHSQSKLGDWNMRWILKADDRTLAIYMPGVWQVFDQAFKPAYNQRVIESLLAENGIAKSRQRFHRSEDESKAWYRLQLNAGCDSSGNKVDLGQPETTLRWCYELPSKLLSEFSAQKSINEINEGDFSPELETESGNPSLIFLKDQDQRRSTEINGSDENPNLVDLCRSPLIEQINGQISNPEQSGGHFLPSVDLLIEKNTNSDLEKSCTEVTSSMAGVTVDPGSLPIPERLEEGQTVWAQVGGEWKQAIYDRPVAKSLFSPTTRALEQGHQVRFGRNAVKVTIMEIRICL